MNFREASERIADIVSHVLNAPFFALYLLFIILYNESLDVILNLLTVVLGVLLLVIAPTALIAIESRRGRVDYFVSDVRKRPKFFIPPLISYILGFTIFQELGVRTIALYYLCYFTVTLVILLVTLKWKISVHAAGVCGPITFTVYVYGLEYCLLYLLVPLVAWSRVALKAHTKSQVTIGAIIAGLITYLTCLAYDEIYFLNF
ncbi:MAG: hypothetical protein DRJ59_04065 [Thermoprotei archaeon]|nr:MAG: hypothetical protein DRJ59_04065 [Thermoprotei archaeon]